MRMVLLGCFSLLLAGGCAPEKIEETPEEQPGVTQVSVEKKAEPEAAIAEKKVEPKSTVDSRASRIKESVGNRLRSARGAMGKPGSLKGNQSRNRRVSPPKGMKAHPDFVGARVGLIHTANVMGEVDPCG